MTLLLGKRILLVEDEFLVADLAEGILQDLGVEVVGPAYTLASGLDLAREAEVDAAVLDVNLNGERSDAIAEVLSAGGVPHMFVTGYGQAGLSCEGAKVLDKPYEATRLERALLELLGLQG